MSDVQEPTSEAIVIIQEAYDRFQEIVASDDLNIFLKTSLHDVKTSARNLENLLATRQEIPNTGCLIHLFAAFDRYAEAAAEIRCDTNFMPLLWAPVRLNLELTGEYKPVITRLIAMYKRMAVKIPDFKKLPPEFRSSGEFQQILAIFYSLILDFHGRIYLQLRKAGWKIFFEYFLDKFKRRFEVMLQSLSSYSQLLWQMPTSHDVEEARMAQESKVDDVTSFEEEQNTTELFNVQSWLDASKLDQDNKLDDLHSHCHKDSCDWIFANAKIKSWIRQGADHSVLWLKGKPGSGKSVLCGKLVQHLSKLKDSVVIYYFCDEDLPETKSCLSLLRSLIRQLIQKQQSLCSFVQKGYVNKGVTATTKQLREVLQNLLVAFKSIRIVADGIDECSEKEQKLILTELLTLTGFDTSKRTCKVLISSQDIVSISRSLQERSIIDLSNERVAIQTAISAFVRSKMDQSPLFSNAGGVDKELLEKAEQALVDKADGMFLWVQLVIEILEQAYSPQEMQQALDDIPKDLESVYQKIFTRIDEQAKTPNSDKTSRIFQWLTCSHRPLRKYELQDAVTLYIDNTVINEETRAHEHVFELCKPLVESSSGGVVRFVHVTVKDFLLKQSSGPHLFDLSTAQFNATFSCLTYLSFGVTLIDDQYDDESRLVEVGKGFHGLCQYACRYWIEHLLEYLQLTEHQCSDLKQLILRKANSLAQSLSVTVAQEHLSSHSQRRERLEKQAKLDNRSKLLKGHEPLYSLVLSALEARLVEKISPRHADKATDRTTGHPVHMIRRKYESLVAQLLRASSVEGLNEKTLTAFKKTYSMCVLVCRFANCARELHGFATAHERDEHEATHTRVYQCPHPECSMHRIGLPNNRKLQQHLLQFHPEPAESQGLPPIKPFGEYRVATDATLVNPPSPDGESKNVVAKNISDIDEGEGEEEEEEEEDYDLTYGKLDRFATTDAFALGSTQWT